MIFGTRASFGEALELIEITHCCVQNSTMNFLLLTILTLSNLVLAVPVVSEDRRPAVRYQLIGTNIEYVVKANLMQIATGSACLPDGSMGICRSQFCLASIELCKPKRQ